MNESTAMLNSACQGRPGVAWTCRTLPGPTRHESEHHDHPRAYAVDGALYYAKYLKEEYNVIAVGISGTSPDALRVDAYYWSRQSTEPIYLQKCRDVCLEPAAYLDIIRGRKLAKKYSIEQIRQTAQSINARLREAKVTEKDKPIFVAGILIALEDEGFAQSYERITTFGLLFDALMGACGRVLGSSGLPSRKVQTIARAVERMREYPSLRSRRLGTIGSLSWHIRELEMKIEPMMRYPGSTVDALGVFYQEFIRYTGGDGKALGIVLTPTHLTEFMAKAVGVTKSDRVLDTCCGSASFLVTCMGMMYGQASEEEREGIRSSHLFGIVQPRGKVACIVPTSCALGKKHVEVRKHLMLHHRLDAVFSMPDDLFYPTGVTTCVMVWEAHCPHDEKRTTFFGYCKDDGHVKVKNLGRVDRYSRWHDIEARWLQLYAERAVEPGATRTGKPWRGTCARCPMPRSCHEDPASGWHR